MESDDRETGITTLLEKGAKTTTSTRLPKSAAEKEREFNTKWKRVLMGITIALLIITLFFIIFAFVRGFLSKEGTERAANNSIMDFFKTANGDAYKITWYHAANSQAKLQEAIRGPYMMIEADINVRWYGLSNQTTEPIMAHPPDVDSDLTFKEWMEKIIDDGTKGMKLDFKSMESVRPALKMLADRREDITFPVLANADIIRGPMGGRPKDHKTFISAVNELYPDVTYSLGWTTGCCEENYTMGQMEQIWDIVKDLKQPVTFPVRAALTRPSWKVLKWLLSKDPERFSLTVWTSAGVTDWEGATVWDMLYCRNDVYKSKIYFDLTPGEKLTQLNKAVETAGAPVNHFSITNMDAMLVTWTNDVNSQQKLTEALNGDEMMLVADVIIKQQGTVNQTNIPLMVRPPEVDIDITLEQWLDQVLKTNKGIKLKFSSIEALEPSLNLLKMKSLNLTQPVFIHADVLKGPGDTDTPINRSEFKRLTNEIFPWVTLSLGWTTNRTNQQVSGLVYTNQNIKEMTQYISDLNQPVTISVRATMVKESWEDLKMLLNISGGRSLTIWSDVNDSVNGDDVVFIRQNADHSKIYIDFHKELRDKVLGKM